MKRRNKKDIDEIIKEELKYSEYLNTRIKEINRKAKSGKQKITNKKNNFKFMNEFKYLQSEERKLENELVIQLYNINENEIDSKDISSKEKSNEILNHFYYNTRIEKEIKSQFNIIFRLIRDLINKRKLNKTQYKNNKTRKSNNNIIDKNNITDSNISGIDNSDISTISKLIEDLKSTNNNLIEITESDFTELTQPLLIDEETNIDDRGEKNDFISLLFLNDSDNIININEIDYLIGQELFQSEQMNHLSFNFIHSNYYLYKNLINKILINNFTPPIINYQIPLQLKEKTLLLLGNEEGNNNIKKIEKSFELVNVKYKNDYNELIKELKSKLIEINKEGINTYIKLRCNNFIYFIKHSNVNMNNQDSINKFLKEKVGNSGGGAGAGNVNKYKKYFEFIDYLFGYKNNIRILTIKYKDETEKLKNNIISILNEEINNQKNILNDRIDKYNFNNRKKQMELIHQKNVEIYNIKEKIKKEELEFEEKIKKKKEEEKKKKENLRQLVNKERVKFFNDEKNLRQQKIDENFKIEEEIRRNKEKKELEKRLPYIINNNIMSENKFLKNQRQKYVDKAIAEENERRLNDIIENYKCRPKVEADEKRLNAITENLENRYHSIIKKTDLDEKVNLFSHNGYTVEQLMKDFRYKVSSALYEAGLSNKLATQEALRNISLITSPIANNNII